MPEHDSSGSSSAFDSPAAEASPALYCPVAESRGTSPATTPSPYASTASLAPSDPGAAGDHSAASLYSSVISPSSVATPTASPATSLASSAATGSFDHSAASLYASVTSRPSGGARSGYSSMNDVTSPALTSGIGGGSVTPASGGATPASLPSLAPAASSSPSLGSDVGYQSVISPSSSPASSWFSSGSEPPPLTSALPTPATPSSSALPTPASSPSSSAFAASSPGMTNGLYDSPLSPSSSTASAFTTPAPAPAPMPTAAPTPTVASTPAVAAMPPGLGPMPVMPARTGGPVRGPSILEDAKTAFTPAAMPADAASPARLAARGARDDDALWTAQSRQLPGGVGMYDRVSSPVAADDLNPKGLTSRWGDAKGLTPMAASAAALPLHDEYVGEDAKHGMDGQIDPNTGRATRAQARYLQPGAERDQFNISADEKGRATDATGAALSTHGARGGLIGAAENRMIFASGADNQLRAANAWGETGAGHTPATLDSKGNELTPTHTSYFHHSAFNAGGAVASAGEIGTSQARRSEMLQTDAKGAVTADPRLSETGWVKSVSNESGHYPPGKANTLEGLYGMTGAGLNLDNTDVSLHGDATTYKAGPFMESRGNTDLLKKRTGLMGDIRAAAGAPRKPGAAAPTATPSAASTPTATPSSASSPTAASTSTAASPLTPLYATTASISRPSGASGGAPSAFAPAASGPPPLLAMSSLFSAGPSASSHFSSSPSAAPTPAAPPTPSAASMPTSASTPTSASSAGWSDVGYQSAVGGPPPLLSAPSILSAGPSASSAFASTPSAAPTPAAPPTPTAASSGSSPGGYESIFGGPPPLLSAPSILSAGPSASSFFASAPSAAPTPAAPPTPTAASSGPSPGGYESIFGGPPPLHAMPSLLSAGPSASSHFPSTPSAAPTPAAPPTPSAGSFGAWSDVGYQSVLGASTSAPSTSPDPASPAASPFSHFAV